MLILHTTGIESFALPGYAMLAGAGARVLEIVVSWASPAEDTTRWNQSSVWFGIHSCGLTKELTGATDAARCGGGSDWQR